MRANSAMSVQLVAPHSVAISAMNKISVRSCSALFARGSGNSEKHSANRCIGCSIQIRSYLQNRFLPIWQPLAHANMRFPCLEGEGRLTLSEAKCETGWGDSLSAVALPEWRDHPTPLALRAID